MHDRPPALHHPPQASARAFTLVELLVVIAIMVMLLAFTMPILRSGNNMNKTAWDIAGTLEKARAYAQSQNTYVWVGLNTADVSTSADKRVAVFMVSSSDGTKSTLATNLVQLDRVHVFGNVSIVDTDKTEFSYVARPGTDIHYMNTPSSGITFPNTVKYFNRAAGSATTTVNLFSSANNYILRIDSTGSITPLGVTAEWLELGLSSMRGGSAVEDDTAVVQIASLTGRITVQRKGDIVTQSEPEE